MPLGSQLADALTSVDGLVGDGIEWAVKDHHRRRLERHDWLGALEPGPGEWARGQPPPRLGCALEVLIDGADAFAATAAAIRGARESVFVAQWFMNPGFELVRGVHAESIGALLAEAAERGVDVRVLVWAGSPIPLFSPTRRQAKAAVAELTRATRIRCEMDPHEHALHCHHEKTVVVDQEVAFVGAST